MSKRILILGSKPESKLPQIKPDLIYSANGAAERMQYYSNCYKIAVVSSGMTKEQSVMKRIVDANPHQIIIRNHKNFYNSSIDKLGFQVENINGSSMSSIEKSVFGSVVFKAVLMHLLSCSFQKGIHLYINHCLNRNRIFACSTGLFTLAYASIQHPEARLYVAGIGLQEGEHFYNAGSFQSITAYKDYLITSKGLAKKNKIKNCLLTTDPFLAKIAQIDLIQ